MAFSNEYLTEEEIELFKETEHDAFIRKHPDRTVFLGGWCTTDREKKIWLMRYPRSYDFDPRLKEEYFVIFYGAIHKDNIVELCLKDLGREADANIKKEYGVNTIQYWSIKDIKISSQLKVNKQVIVNMLEELMTGYGICGNPEHKGPGFDGRFKAIIKECREV